jgi:hypothetical protein
MLQRSEYSRRHNTFLTCMPADYQFVIGSSSTTPTSYSSDLSQTRKAETRRRVAAERRNELLLEVVGMEVKMGITSRWQPDGAEYMETLKYMAERRYHRALDHLQKLVVQRLFELNKLNLARTGYRMRKHIAKSLQTRCKAIQNAVKTYNTAALEMTPPRPTIDWSQASHYSFLEDFNLLRDTQQGVHAKPWAQPVIRAAMRQVQRIKRAQEEIYNCNIEVRRLHTHILDESADLKKVVDNLKAQNHPVTGAVEDFALRRHRTNAFLLTRIHAIHGLVGFSGDRTPGIRVGRVDELARSTEDIVSPNKEVIEEEDDDHEYDCLDEDDEARGEYEGLVDFVSEMSLRD